MMIRSQILGLIYAVTGSSQANLWPNAKMQDPVSIQSEKREETSRLRVHIHRLPAPDKDPVLLQQNTVKQISVAVVQVHCLHAIRPGHNLQR